MPSRVPAAARPTAARPTRLRPVFVRPAAAGITLLLAVAMATASTGGQARAAGSPGDAPSLGVAESFAVLAGSTVTNIGPTAVGGDLGVAPGSAVIGFPPGLVTGGIIHSANPTANQAQSDLTTAYNNVASATPTASAPSDVGGLTLTAGVYQASSALSLTGTLTLDGAADDVFIFQIGSTLTTGTASRVVLSGGVQACNVFWQVGGSVALGTASVFAGTVMALTSVTVTTGATVDGRALARNGAVTLDNATVTVPACQQDAGGGDDDGDEGGDGEAPDGGTAAGAEDADALAATGAAPLMPAAGALLLLVFGALAIVAKRRRTLS